MTSFLGVTISGSHELTQGTHGVRWERVVSARTPGVSWSGPIGTRGFSSESVRIEVGYSSTVFKFGS